MSSQLLGFPGKVLFVDDHFDQITELMEKLAEFGMPVQYWHPGTTPDPTITNVRIIILDLYLKDTEDVRGTPSFYVPAAEALGKIQGPYILFIFADGYDSSKDIKGLSEAFLDKHKKSINTIGEITGIEKDVSDVTEVIEKIKAGFKETDILKMILTWDGLLNDAKDRTLLKLSEKDFESEIQEFVRSIASGIDDNSLSREFVSTMIRFISRYVNTGSEYGELGKILKRIKNTSTGDVENPILQHLQMYYKPEISEKVWTGDIYQMDSTIEGEDAKFWNFSLVLTPACDIAQQEKKKLETFHLCEGCIVNTESVKDPDHPFRRNVKAFKFPKKGLLTSDEKFDKEIQNQLWIAAKNLPERFFAVWHLRNEDGKYFGVCFDFQRLKSLKIDDFESKWNEKRIFRLDSPFVDELLQKFGSHAYRLGTPDINIPSKS